MTNLRWIMRDGERVLQQLVVRSGISKLSNGMPVFDEWARYEDVPLEEEQVTG